MIVGITAAGTYYSPWTPYTLKSIYPICDKIVVVNGGFDLQDPKLDVYNVPLPEVTRDIKMIDRAGKVEEITGFTTDTPKHKMRLGTQRDNQGKIDWFDLRGLNLTIANERAVELGADRILKVDTDQVLFEDCIKLRDMPDALLWQYEVHGDAFHLARTKPSSPYNDSVFMYKAKDGQFYGGGGSPAIYADRSEAEHLRCVHCRHARPPHIDNSQALKGFYGRVWFSLMTNEGIIGDVLHRKAQELAESAMNSPTDGLEPFTPPKIVSRWKAWLKQ